LEPPARSFPAVRRVQESVAQLDLFANDVRVLVDDRTGRITYRPNLVDDATQRRWFESLLAQAPWRSERRVMYDREVDVPRLVAAYPADATQPGVVPEMRSIVEAACEMPFTSIGLNLYRDGRDSVSPHNDHLNELRPGYPIALLSLGSTRRMTIRSKTAPRRNLDLDLEPGSLLVMSYATQRTYDNGIHKTHDPVDARISVAFRVRL